MARCGVRVKMIGSVLKASMREEIRLVTLNDRRGRWVPLLAVLGRAPTAPAADAPLRRRKR